MEASEGRDPRGRTPLQLSRRRVLQLGASGTAAALLAAACGRSGNGTAGEAAGSGMSGEAQSADITYNWLTWQDHYVSDPDQLGEVRETTNITARPQLFSDNSEAYTKIQQTGDQFDVVSGDALWVPKFYEDGLTDSFDMAEIAVSSELYSLAKEYAPWMDGSHHIGYPFGWSMNLLFYNPKYVETVPDSWDALLDPKYKGRIVTENQPVDIHGYAAKATGARDAWNMTEDELADANEWLRQLKPNVLKLTAQSEESVRALVDESAWIATGNLGYDIRVLEAGGPEVKSVVPKEGTVGWADAEMMVKAGSNKGAFTKFLNALERAEYIAENFLSNGRPLFNERAYKVLVDNGHKEQADRYFYNQPEVAFDMDLKGPSENVDAYIQSFNEVFGG